MWRKSSVYSSCCIWWTCCPVALQQNWLDPSGDDSLQLPSYILKKHNVENLNLDAKFCEKTTRNVKNEWKNVTNDVNFVKKIPRRNVGHAERRRPPKRIPTCYHGACLLNKNLILGRFKPIFTKIVRKWRRNRCKFVKTKK